MKTNKILSEKLERQIKWFQNDSFRKEALREKLNKEIEGSKRIKLNK